MMVWIDLETTGLNPRHDFILEVACIVTDDRLAETARFQAVANTARLINLESVNQVVRDMHAKNGLWGESIASGKSWVQVSTNLWTFIKEHAPPTTDDKGREVKPVLAGSTVSFDRSFLAEQCPDIVKLLHYRNLDVSSIYEMSKRVWPAVVAPKSDDPPHRAIPDLEASIAMARHYARVLQPIESTRNP